MFKAILTSVFAVSACAALAKDQPPEPADKPNFIDVGNRAIHIHQADLVDPESMRFHWTSGFQWGFFKIPLRPREFGWIACGEYNAKNRMGGYNGYREIFAFITPSGDFLTGYTRDVITTCDKDDRAPVMPELIDQRR